MEGVGASPSSRVGGEARREGLLVIVDNESPPGAWRDEMERMPWRYSQQVKVNEALASIRKAGFAVEANVLAQEISVLKAEVESLRSKP